MIIIIIITTPYPITQLPISTLPLLATESSAKWKQKQCLIPKWLAQNHTMCDNGNSDGEC
jgi:hypothetical protein